MDRAA